MGHLTQYRLIGIGGMVGMLALSPAVGAATYQCEQDGVVVYSDTRCGPAAEQAGEVGNLYPGGLRAGEQRMLNETTTRQTTPTAGDDGTGYGERLREKNERRKLEGDKRRIPSKATSPWH